MAEFKDRLKELRIEKGLTQQALADMITVHGPEGMHGMSISGYERGVRKPSFEVLDALADIFNVSLDYLLGNTDNRIPYPRYVIESALPRPALMRDTEKRAQAYFKGMTAAEAARAEKLEKTHRQILEAYDAALPQIKKAVLDLLDIRS